MEREEGRRGGWEDRRMGKQEGARRGEVLWSPERENYGVNLTKFAKLCGGRRICKVGNDYNGDCKVGNYYYG